MLYFEHSNITDCDFTVLFFFFRCTHNGCGHRFTSSSNLQYHYRCHASTGKTFICPECQFMYEHWRGVVMHLWKDHTIDIDLHACSECSYKTFSYFKLDNHKVSFIILLIYLLFIYFCNVRSGFLFKFLFA